MNFKGLSKKIGKEFVYGGHLLSLGASSIVWSTMILADVSILSGLPIIMLAYLSSQIVYNHDHLDELNDELANAERSKHLRETRNYQIGSLIFYIVLFGIFSLYTSLAYVLLGVFIVVGGIFYTKKAKKFTKRVLAFKNIYIATFWSVLAFFVPLHSANNWQNIIPLFFFAFFVFVRWIINSVFFDIKDRSEDKHKKLKTLPATFGLSKTLQYLHIFNFASAVCIVLFVLLNILPAYSLSLLVFPIYSYYYLSKTPALDEKNLRKISYIMVDGEYFFWPIILMASKLLGI